MWWILPVLLLGFALVHCFKMLRLYLVLMEHKIGFGRFILMYFKTTFINLIIPFKLGELYRIFSISRLSGVWQVGILSVCVDRFFDMVALVLVLVPFDLMIHGKLTIVTCVLLTAILLLTALYLIIMPSYTYLNRYLIMHKSSKRAMVALRGMDVTKEWYTFIKNLVTGRFALITLASLAGWIVEVGVLKLFSMYCLGYSFGTGDFGNYIEAIFTGADNVLLMMYTRCGAVIMLVAAFVGQMIYYFSLAKNKKNEAGRI